MELHQVLEKVSGSQQNNCENCHKEQAIILQAMRCLRHTLTAMVNSRCTTCMLMTANAYSLGGELLNSVGHSQLL